MMCKSDTGTGTMNILVGTGIVLLLWMNTIQEVYSFTHMFAVSGRYRHSNFLGRSTNLAIADSVCVESAKEDDILSEMLAFAEEEDDDDDAEMLAAAGDDDDDDDEEEKMAHEEESDELTDDDNIILRFVEIVQETEPGGLATSDAELLLGIINDFPEGLFDEQPAMIVEMLLYRLIDEWYDAVATEDDEKETAFRPTTEAFTTAIKTWEESDSDDKSIRVLSILSDQREIVMNGLETVAPDLDAFKSVLRVLADTREKGIERRAGQVFDSIADYGLQPDAELHGLLISIVAKCRQPRAASQAEKMLREAVEIHPPKKIDGVVTGIGREVFNVVVTAHAKSGEKYGPSRAQEVIVLMDQIDAQYGGYNYCNPNITTFTSLIDAYAQQSYWGSVAEAEKMLNRLLDHHLNGQTELEPNIATWTIVIGAWGRLAKQRPDAAQKAGQLLRRMEDLWKTNRINFKPDAIAYRACMNAHAYSKDPLDTEEAERILDEMNEMYLDGDDTMKPSTRAVSSCIDSWIAVGNTNRAEALLDKYEETFDLDDKQTRRDLTKIYQNVIFAFAAEGDIPRAIEYLKSMIDEDMGPDFTCFERIIGCNTRDNGDLKNAVEVFQLMESYCKEGKKLPHERVYRSFMRALTKSRASNLHKKVNALLKRMHRISHEDNNADMEPTIMTYNEVLHACSECVEIEDVSLSEAFRVAFDAFSTVRSHMSRRMTTGTFSSMIRCARLLPDDGTQREKFLQATFQLCCDKGLVNEHVVRDLQLVAKEDQWRSLLECPTGDVYIERLPYDWTAQLKQSSTRDRPSRDRPSRQYNRRKNDW